MTQGAKRLMCEREISLCMLACKSSPPTGGGGGGGGGGGKRRQETSLNSWARVPVHSGEVPQSHPG